MWLCCVCVCAHVCVHVAVLCVCGCVLCVCVCASYQPHPAVIGYLAFAGVQIQGLSHETAMVQVGLRVPTPLAVWKGLFSCEFLARLQELCLHGSQCLLSASWICQVCVTH